MGNEEPKEAGFIWFIAGFAFGIFACIVALITDNGDGRVRQTVSGFLAITITVVVSLMLTSFG